MASDTTAILGMPYLMPSQAQKHVTHNEALKVLDALVQLSVVSKSGNAPPGAPVEGERHIAGPSPTGAWAGHAGKVVAWLDGVWEVFAPVVGWVAYIADEGVLAIWTGSTWTEINQNIPMLGINAAADTTNRLNLSSDASLFNHAGDDHQMKINKAASGDTASLLFQTGFSGRAEFGLAGEDNFSVKVSVDGSAWSTGITLDAASGLVATPAGVLFTPVLTSALPAATAGLEGMVRYVSDISGGGQLAYCDGTDWLKVSDGTPI